MRHGLMMRTLAAAALALVVGGFAQAGGKKDCDTCAPVVVNGVGTAADCGGCSAGTKKALLGKLAGGNACCDAKFALGSSKGFFAACNPGCSDLPISVFHGANGCGGLSGLRKNCPTPIYGPGIGVPANSCHGVYSHLFR
jgi:hypothetical protein